MATLALSLARSPAGFIVKHGGAALYVPPTGELSALAEERIERTKAAPGWRGASTALLERAGVRPSGVTQVYVVGCAGTQESYLEQVRREGVPAAFPNADIEIVGHHEAHAALAMAHTDASKGFTLVADAGGDLLAGSSSIPYWRHQREQASLWRWSAGELQRVRQLGPVFNWGIGEFYRAVTHFLGFRSQIWSSKVMALAPYGLQYEPLQLPHPVRYGNQQILSVLHGNPLNDPSENLRRWLCLHGVNSTPTEKERAQIALWAQTVLETCILDVFQSLPEDGSSFALSGGVAYNCAAIGKLGLRTGRPISVPYAPGDTGVSLGALLAREPRAREVYRRERRFLGPATPTVPCSAQALRTAGSALANGDLVALCVGRSELGQRALGNRSLLASLSSAQPGDLLRERKRRAIFQPLALSMLREDATALFNLPTSLDLAGMGATVIAHPSTVLPHGIHVDRTCRMQVVEEFDDSPLATLLRLERKRTGLGALINTSLNAAGNVVPETLFDAKVEARHLGTSSLVTDLADSSRSLLAVGS